MEINWKPVEPPVYQRGDLYETQSVECGYSPDIKFILTYSDGSTFTKYCNEHSYILGSEVMEGGQKSEITEIFIGSCVRGVDTNAFNGVCKLKRVNSNVDGVMNIPEGVLELGENAFTWNCSSCYITSITLPSTLQRLSLDAFDSDYCHQTLTINAVTPPYMYLDEYDYFPKPIYVPCQSVSAYKSASGWSQFKDYIFGIPPCVQPKFQATYSGGQTYERECDGNTTLTKGDTHPTNYELSAMTNAVIGDCVAVIGCDAFSGCTSLTSVTIPNGVTEIGEVAFSNCSGLTSVTIPNSVTRIDGGAFYGCSGLTSITIPNSVTIIYDGVFGSCFGLTSINIPSGVTYIGEMAFSWCTNLTGITIPNGVTSIGKWAFQNCSSFTSITIPNSVTDIGIWAFLSCTSLISVTIGNGVTTIGGGAFISCTSLTSVTCLATVPPTLGDDGVFYDTNNCNIYVPASSVETYKSATNWSTYADRIFPIT